MLKRKNDLEQELKESESAIKRYEETLSGNDVSFEEIDAYNGVYKDYSEIKAKREVSFDSVSTIEKEIQGAKIKKPPKKTFIAFLALSILTALSGIGFSFLSIVAGVIVCVV